MQPAVRRPGSDGHLLVLYYEEPQRRLQVEAWVRRGLDVGAKILHIEPPDESPIRSLAGVLRDQPDAVDALGTGQIEVIPADPAAYDPAWQASVVDRALLRYPLVRWSGDATTAWGVIPQPRHADFELATDEVCSTRPVSVMCHYPARESMEVLGLVSGAHRAGVRDGLVQWAPIAGGLAVSGELERGTQDTFRSVLLATTTTTGADRFVVDLSGLSFVDLAGVRTLLLGTDDYRRRGGQVRLRNAQTQVDGLLRLLGVDRAEGLLVEAPR